MTPRADPLPAVVEAIAYVEREHAGRPGWAKQDAAVDRFAYTYDAPEDPLIQDAEIQAATRALMTAGVQLQNLWARKRRARDDAARQPGGRSDVAGFVGGGRED